MLRDQLIKFLFVGVINTIFGYSLFALLIFIGLHYTIAVFIGTIIGIAFNFKTTGKYVFNNTDNTLFFYFIGVYVFIYFFNIISLWLLQKIGVTNMYVAGAILILPAAVISFVLNRTFVFKNVS